MRIGTTLTTMAVTSSLVALTIYGVWSVSIRRDQLLREVVLEEANLATVLKSALDMALENRQIAEAADVVERLSTADRVFGIAVHSESGQELVVSRELAAFSEKVPPELIDPHLESDEEQQFQLEVEGRKFLVHILPIHNEEGQKVAVAEVWRDLRYIDEYLSATKWRLLVLAVIILCSLVIVIVLLTRASITRPAERLVQAMEQVSSGNLDVRLAGAGPAPPGELGDIARAFDRLTASLKEARQALESSQRDRESLAVRVRQSERLAMLGQVVAEVAHELGTPLNVITGRAEILSHELKEDPRSLETVEQISQQAGRITRIIHRLLHVARERMPTMNAVPLAKVARSTAGFLAPELERAGIRIIVSGNERDCAMADEDMMQQVLINLIGNAIQASSSGTTIRVQVSSTDDEVAVDVIDEGSGVSAEILPRLFEPFATTKPAGKGTGLGLSISRSILRQMGGSLRYIEGSERGAHFRAILPSAGQPREEEPAALLMRETV